MVTFAYIQKTNRDDRRKTTSSSLSAYTQGQTSAPDHVGQHTSGSVAIEGLLFVL